jgi:hypothetical protein
MMLSSIAFRREFEWPREEFNRADDRVTRLFADEHKPAFTFAGYNLRRVAPRGRTRHARACSCKVFNSTTEPDACIIILG